MINPFEQPDFIFARTVEPIGDDLNLLTFPDGFQCYSHSSEQETALMYNEIFIKQEYLGSRLTLNDCSYVFDVGANIGLFTLFAKLSNRDLVVHAFEPVKASYDVLVKNIALHGLTDVYPHNYGLGNQDKHNQTITFYPKAAGNSTTHPDSKVSLIQLLSEALGQEETDYLFQSPQKQTIQVRTLSAVIEQAGIPIIDLLKIDTESDELNILQGIKKTHFPMINQITAEVHSDSLLARCQSMLTSNGFRIVSETGIASGNNLYAVNNCSF